MIRSAPNPPWLTQIERGQSQQPLEMRIHPSSGMNRTGGDLLIAGAHRFQRPPDELKPNDLLHRLHE
jgi:hypothetical protein